VSDVGEVPAPGRFKKRLGRYLVLLSDPGINSLVDAPIRIEIRIGIRIEIRI
jgi:hypothetical protein